MLPSIMDASEGPNTSESSWIAMEPPRSLGVRQADQSNGHTSSLPPSFADSQFDIILRRQRTRPPEGGGIKLTALPSRFINLSNHFEFAGWGSLTNIKLQKEDLDAGEEQIHAYERDQVLGQFTASALAGNAVLGGVFYTLPAVVAVAGVYTPISLFIATLFLFLWRPIMEELASALPIRGAPYTYLMNVSTKSFALIGASLLLLDYAATLVVSAATASAYLVGEVTLPFGPFVATILIVVVFTLISLGGVKESARIALAVLCLHIATMMVLIIAAAMHWHSIGMSQLGENWMRGNVHPSSIARQIFNGICLGMLGLTGFECTPSYIARIVPGNFPRVLRNLHYPAILFNTLIMLLLLAVLPLSTILNGTNVLSTLAQTCAGRWLKLWIAVDAIIVLCGGVITGILSACEMLEQLSKDRVTPGIFLKTLPRTGAPYVSVVSFVAFCLLLYASSGANLIIISEMFSFVWLLVMALFPLSLLLLKFNRGRMPRQSRAPLSVIILALLIVPVVLAGNIAIDPIIAGYFAIYFCAIYLVFSATQNKIHLLRWLYWTYDQYPFLHGFKLTKKWGAKIITTMRNMKRRPVCILTKTDEINHLFHMILYVRKNEETSCAKLVHFIDAEKGVPSELEANAKILDEAFPEITIDLVLVHESFQPINVASLAHRLGIPTSLMFMTCPGSGLGQPISEFGTRIIAL